MSARSNTPMALRWPPTNALGRIQCPPPALVAARPGIMPASGLAVFESRHAPGFSDEIEGDQATFILMISGQARCEGEDGSQLLGPDSLCHVPAGQPLLRKGLATRKSSMTQQPRDAPWYGLIKFRPYCDEPNPAYSYHTDTYLALGLRETAAALRTVGMAEPAQRLATESAAYEKDILASMDRAVLERKGTRMLPVFPETRALLERVGYTGADYYSLVGSMVLETGLIPAADHRARLITDLLEQKNGLILGTCQFQGGIDHAYTYGYWMNCLERDEVKRVILGFYTSLAYGMSRGTYAGVEVTRLRTGENYATLPHLYSGTQQLLLLRNMLLREQDQDLWIGQAIPRPWLEDGKEVRIENAPTLFGKAGFVIRSTDGARRMTAELNPPVDRPPQRIHLRLRHPNHRALAEVTVNGVPHRDFRGETVTLAGLKGAATIQARFDSPP